MSEKGKELGKILSQEVIGTEIYSMWIELPQISAHAKPGQFVSLFCTDKSRLLPRPISICEIEREKHALRLVYRVVGKGTKEFSKMNVGETLEVMGPLGNGFPIERMEEGKKAFLIGGGIGIPPMVELAKQLKCEKQMIVGYRD